MLVEEVNVFWAPFSVLDHDTLVEHFLNPGHAFQLLLISPLVGSALHASVNVLFDFDEGLKVFRGKLPIDGFDISYWVNFTLLVNDISV